MSAQRLADRCAELGHGIPRAVIANLENGYRESVSVAELLVLAAALDVTPADLILPVGQELDADVLPDVRLPLLDAAHWLGGLAVLDVSRRAANRAAAGTPLETAVQLYNTHLQANRALMSHLAAGPDQYASISDEAERARYWVKMREPYEQVVLRVRTEMRRRGLPLPPLPAEIGYLDATEGSR